MIAPAHNEEDNVVLLVEQIEAALKPALGEAGFEILIVDDASTDATPGRVMQMQASRPYLRLITLARPKAGGGNGQSAAFKAGFAAAWGELVGSRPGAREGLGGGTRGPWGCIKTPLPGCPGG